MTESRKHNKSDLASINFDEIMKPYRSAGTKSHPYQMDLKTLAGALVINKKVPPDIAGAVIFQTMYEIKHSGLDFPGNGKYGSKWQELANHIRGKCIELMERGAEKEVLGAMKRITSCVAMSCPMRTMTLANQTRMDKIKMFFMVPRLGILPLAAGGGCFIAGYAYHQKIIKAIIGVLNGAL